MTTAIRSTSTQSIISVGGVDALVIDAKGIVSGAPQGTIRQTVLCAPVDSAGATNLGGSTGGTSVTTSNVSATDPLVVSAANGFGMQGGNNVYGFSDTNIQWTGLSTNGVMYLYVDIANGVLTTGSTTLVPAYQMGGTYSTTNNKFTFNIQEMKGKVGNGSAANQVNRVFVGEVLVASNVVSTISWYALRGQYNSGRSSVSASSTYSKNHLIGCEPFDIRMFTASSVGGNLQPAVFEYTAAYNGLAVFDSNRLSVSYRAQGGLAMVYNGDGLAGAIAEALVVVTRGWN